MKCALCGKPAEYVFGGFSLCESCMIQMRTLPIEPIGEPEPKKPEAPRKVESAPSRYPTNLVGEIKTVLDKEKFDVNRLKFEETEKTVIVTPRAWLQDDWAIVNQVVKDFKGAWIRDGQQSRWEVKK